ncbi:MAG: agmatine deiminase [Bacteroidetes bacterium]|nr:agmatine deiminase [Bacteroidota bacterium]
MNTTILPAEWAPQSAVQLTWPHVGTDWAPYLDEAVQCFSEISTAIAKRQKLLIVCQSEAEVRPFLINAKLENIRFAELPTNDTWARDHGGITVVRGGQPVVLDFKFNGWGLKFPADKDNLITRQLFELGVFSEGTKYENQLNYVLEGGGIESDGLGTILTTSECLLSPNRNGAFSRSEIEKKIKRFFGATRILWLENGYLAGDDTDSHIDTLARLCDEKTIAYVKCEDPLDEHFEALRKMETELQTLRQANGEPYKLVALPMADAVYFDGDRLPATYANFLIINGAVLVPFYQSVKDAEVKRIFEHLFPNREIIGINCLPLIKQHGSLHCVTMQFPENVIF